MMNRKFYWIIGIITFIITGFTAYMIREWLIINELKNQLQESSHIVINTSNDQDKPIDNHQDSHNSLIIEGLHTDELNDDSDNEIINVNEVPDSFITDAQQKELDLIISDYKSKASNMVHPRQRYDLWSSLRESAYQEMQESQKLLHENDFIGIGVDQFLKHINSLSEQERVEFKREYAKHLNAYKYAYTKFDMLSDLNPLSQENSNEK